MRLDELDQKVQDKLPFDVVDDVHFHMINDDAFYRKYYMPCMDKIRMIETKNQDDLYMKSDRCEYKFRMILCKSFVLYFLVRKTKQHARTHARTHARARSLSLSFSLSLSLSSSLSPPTHTLTSASILGQVDTS